MFWSLGHFRASLFQRRFQQVSWPCFINTTCKLKCLDRDKVKVRLYPEEEDSILFSILESDSMQQVFDTYNSVKSEELSPKYSSQALVTLWDLQKFIFGVRRISQDPHRKEFAKQDHYIQTLGLNTTLHRIVSHTVCHCPELEDEALAASLSCLLHLKFNVRGTNCQSLMNELLKRKRTLDLKGLSRLCVALREKSVYGYIVMAEFAPLLHSYILNMSADEDVRLVTLAIRGAYVVTTRQALNDYVWRVKHVMGQGGVELNPLTLCKMLMLFLERQLEFQQPLGSEPGDEEIIKVVSELLRRIATLLVPYVEKIEEKDLLNISTRAGLQPASLRYAMADRVSRLLDESDGNPSVELVACLQPVGIDQQVKLGKYLKQNMQDWETFSETCHLAYKILRKCPYDKELFDRFWSTHQQIIEYRSTVESDVQLSYYDESVSYDDEDITLSSRECGPLFFLTFGVRYMYTRFQTCRTYRHYGFESCTLKLIFKLLQDYEDGKCVLTTRNYAKCVAFLAATGHANIILKQLFVQQLRVRDLMLIYRGMQLNPRNCLHIATIVGHQTERLLQNSLTAREYVGLARISVHVFSQTAFEMSPVFQECMGKTAEAPWDDVCTASDLLNTMMFSAYNSQPMFERISRFICKAGDDISLKCVTKFSEATYICGTGYFDALETVAPAVERYSERLHPVPLIGAMLGLCYHGQLSKELVHKVFSMGFLDEMDKHMTAIDEMDALRLRESFMQLNRAVCIDMPEVRVPWFHEKYCQEIAEIDGFYWTHVHHEVLEVLSDTLGAHCVARNTYSPYYHVIDFLIRFDKGRHPVPVKSKEEGMGKLAVIVHDYKDYTRGDRRLKGIHVMRRRHLEILGYRVIEIDPVDWNSMRLSEKEAKNDYLQERIYKGSGV